MIGYLYITSERKVIEELRMHLAWRWFTSLGFDQGDSASLHVLEESARTFRQQLAASLYPAMARMNELTHAHVRNLTETGKRRFGDHCTKWRRL